MTTEAVPRRRPALPLLAALALAGALAALWIAPSHAAARASCSGAVEATSFHFKCDTAIGGNSRGWLFNMYSSRIESANVHSPGGVSCEGRSGRITCKGPKVPANTTVSGTFVPRAPSGEEEGGGEEEGTCAGGLSITMLAYGGDAAEGEPGGEEEGEEAGEEVAVPESIARFAINSCGSGEEGRGTEAASFGFGKVKLRKSNGTATLPIDVSTAGNVVVRGKGIVKASRTAKAAGTVKLPVKAKGSVLDKLRDDGHVTVKAKVVFTPQGGEPLTKSKQITLRLSRARAGAGGPRPSA